MPGWWHHSLNVMHYPQILFSIINKSFLCELADQNVISSSSWQYTHTQTHTCAHTHAPFLSLFVPVCLSILQKHSEDLEILMLLDEKQLDRVPMFSAVGRGHIPCKLHYSYSVISILTFFSTWLAFAKGIIALGMWSYKNLLFLFECWPFFLIFFNGFSTYQNIIIPNNGDRYFITV